MPTPAMSEAYELVDVGNPARLSVRRTKQVHSVPGPYD